ncbi:site-specific tyrosine recombinase/integron integrase [Mariniphaga sediminis]|uniref:site-specific tyrosine recombinase/integron integrase n=1 Tax=Mariniphaga sediminis TaxID=1628158 RepID=UPI0035643BE5
MIQYIQIFEDELRDRNYSENTISSYRSVLSQFLADFDTEPEYISEKEIKIYLRNSKSQSLLKQRIGALKRFYQYVMKQPLKFKYIDYPRPEERLPEILSQAEVKRLFEACSNLKHLAILYIFYSTGMRKSELINLKITDIDSEQMIIRIEQGKGKKDRNVPLSEKTLKILRKYYRKYKPNYYLFNGQFSNQYSAESIRNFIKDYAEKAGIRKRVYPHLLRHCNATHLYESGTDLSVIQDLLGHRQIKTTKRYARMSIKRISAVVTPDNFI